MESSKVDINPLIFRAYDIRGIYKQDINEAVFEKIGLALANRHKKFLLGTDIRKNGTKLAKSLILGLKSKGADVFYIGQTSIGLCLFSGWRLKVDKIFFITASHLPSKWNGLKIYDGKSGEALSPQQITKIKNLVLKSKNLKIKPRKVSLNKISFKKEYIEFLLEKFPLLINNNLKIVIDCGNGSMSLIAPIVFKRFGFKVKELFCTPNPLFPNRPSEPTFEATKKLREIVVKSRADFGVAFDGDGDRAIIIDNKGNYLDGNKIGIILARELLKEEDKKVIVKTVSASMAINEEIKQLRAKTIEVPVGHNFVISACKKYKSALGMESTGHFVLPDYLPFDDAILVPLKIAEILIKEQKLLSSLVEKIKIYPYQEFVLNCPDDKKFPLIKDLINKIKKNYKRVSTLDGLKIYFKYGWVLVRASNTSPNIRIYFEAKNKKYHRLLKKGLVRYIKNFILRRIK